jgi:hypothetical protein
LKLAERAELCDEVKTEYKVDIYHLERLAALLNATENYGLRLEFLDIDMTKEEQLAYMVTKDKIIHDLTNLLGQLAPKVLSEDEQSKTAIEVHPESISTRYIVSDPLSLLKDPLSIFKHNKPFHKCSYCNYGYKVARKSEYYRGVLFAGTRPLPMDSVVVTNLITCPKCGNTEEHF